MFQAQIYSSALTTCVGSYGQATQVESWLSYLYNLCVGGEGAVQNSTFCLWEKNE